MVEGLIVGKCAEHPCPKCGQLMHLKALPEINAKQQNDSET